MPQPPYERLPTRRVVSHLGVMCAVSVVLGVVVSGLAIPFAGVLGLSARNVAEGMNELPQELETTALPQKTTITDRNGEVIASVYDQNRVNVSLNNISRIMVKAMVAIEDYRFYEHGALDLKGTMRALATNTASDDVVQGGSSISQQLVKLTLQNQAVLQGDEEAEAAATEESYARKLRELRYAIALEKKHSKDWILERYLNTAYFGDGAYGIQAAAQHYFGRNAKQLKLKHAALLAGLVQNPTAYDPTNFPDRAQKRRDIVLNRLAQLNVIKPGQARKAKKIKVPSLLRVQPSDNGCVSSRSPWFCDYVLNYLVRDKQLGKNKKERMQLLKTGGLTIRTTIDLRAQDAADRAVRNNVYKKDAAIGGLALVEPGTGNVKAVAQSRPMGRRKNEGETYLNHTVPSQYGNSSGFQAGSTFKAFVLATAIEQGIPLSTVISAPATRTFSEESFEDCGGGPYGYGTFPISNYDNTSHLVNLYSGTRDSVNTFFLELESRTGLCKPYELAKQMGVRLTNPTGDENGNGAERVPTFTLGIPDTTPLEMAEAYATFAARGKHCDARPVTRLLDSADNVIRKYPENCDQVMRETTADAVNDVLKGVIHGGFASAQILDQPAAGKTGTTQSGKAVWFIGHTPNMAAAAMVAGANDQGQPESLVGKTVGGSYVSQASGTSYAAPIWGDAMKAIDDWLEYADFVFPSSVPGAGQTYVPRPDPPEPERPSGGNNGGGGNGGGGNGGGNNGGGNGNRGNNGNGNGNN